MPNFDYTSLTCRHMTSWCKVCLQELWLPMNSHEHIWNLIMYGQTKLTVVWVWWGNWPLFSSQWWHWVRWFCSIWGLAAAACFEWQFRSSALPLGPPNWWGVQSHGGDRSLWQNDLMWMSILTTIIYRSLHMSYMYIIYLSDYVLIDYVNILQ